jgi:hypothetical protein
MTITQKLFAVAGVSRFNDTFKVRFASSMDRIKVLAKNDVDLIELPTPMTKEKAVAHLMTSRLMERKEYNDAIVNADIKYNSVEPAKPAKVKKVKAVKVKAKPTLEAIRARTHKTVDPVTVEQVDSLIEVASV